MHVSSTYLLKIRGGVWKVDSASCSTSSITRFANTTDTGDPIAVPWICRYTFKGQVGGLQAKLENGEDVIHSETCSIVFLHACLYVSIIH